MRPGQDSLFRLTPAEKMRQNTGTLTPRDLYRIAYRLVRSNRDLHFIWDGIYGDAYRHYLRGMETSILEIPLIVRKRIYNARMWRYVGEYTDPFGYALHEEMWRAHSKRCWC